jgi:hypothetical protein
MAQTPTVGRVVHYVSFGSPGGEYPSVCRAAVITEVGEDPAVIGLAVLNPTGMFFNVGVGQDDGAETPGAPGCPLDHHAGPFRYCSCGWAEAHPKGGTWHWPERSSSAA